MRKSIVSILTCVLLATAVFVGCSTPRAPQQSSSQQSSSSRQQSSSQVQQPEDGIYTFTNRAYITIQHMYIAPSGTGEWSADALESGLLGMEESLDATVPAEGLNLDFEIVDDEGSYYYAYDVLVLPYCDVYMDAAQEGYAISVDYAEGGNAYIPMEGPVGGYLPDAPQFASITVHNQAGPQIIELYLYHHYTESWTGDLLEGGTMALEDWLTCDVVDGGLVDVEFGTPDYAGIIVRDVTLWADDQMELVLGQDGYGVSVRHADGTFDHYYESNG